MGSDEWETVGFDDVIAAPFLYEIDYLARFNRAPLQGFSDSVNAEDGE